MIAFVRYTMETPWGLGLLSFVLVFVPIIGMHLVHKNGWQYWQPLDKFFK